MRRAATVGVAVMLAGCAGAPQSVRLSDAPGALREPVELRGVPFFPQEAYQCGPAALATALRAAGGEAAPEDLVEEVYLPGRRGSLQAELEAATRRRGHVPYVLDPSLEDVLREVRAGRPVVVLQNLSLACCPVWHFAVVVGYDLGRGEVVLRSGTERRRVTELETFERTWVRAGRWALVVAAPGSVPTTAREGRFIEAVTELERLDRTRAAERAYAGAVERWPRSLGGWVGLGNARYALGDADGALEAFRRAVEVHPDSAAAHNNLAWVLMERGDLETAREAAEQAVRLSDVPEHRDTLEAIRRRSGSRGP